MNRSASCQVQERNVINFPIMLKSTQMENSTLQPKVRPYVPCRTQDIGPMFVWFSLHLPFVFTMNPDDVKVGIPQSSVACILLVQQKYMCMRLCPVLLYNLIKNNVNCGCRSLQIAGFCFRFAAIRVLLGYQAWSSNYLYSLTEPEEVRHILCARDYALEK